MAMAVTVVVAMLVGSLNDCATVMAMAADMMAGCGHAYGHYGGLGCYLGSVSGHGGGRWPFVAMVVVVVAAIVVGCSHGSGNGGGA